VCRRFDGDHPESLHITFYRDERKDQAIRPSVAAPQNLIVDGTQEPDRIRWALLDSSPDFLSAPRITHRRIVRGIPNGEENGVTGAFENSRPCLPEKRRKSLSTNHPAYEQANAPLRQPQRGGTLRAVCNFPVGRNAAAGMKNFGPAGVATFRDGQVTRVGAIRNDQVVPSDRGHEESLVDGTVDDEIEPVDENQAAATCDTGKYERYGRDQAAATEHERVSPGQAMERPLQQGTGEE
jgi:hypothetical protein